MSQLFEVLGGLGVFLLGVAIMSDGLKGLAGDTLRGALARFTRSPTSGAVTGAISTAILQSSSATTVAAVGFVSAGLLSFSQSLGIIFGANIGTTITGWLVALLGFKFKPGVAVLPLILIGVLLHLFGRGRLSRGGLALAGFGLIFVGIATMQAGMGDLQGQVTPDSFPPDTWIGRLQLVFLGVIITLITQSSSAGVATAMTALYTGTINFEQAAALVIGMDVGTTATALMATVGGSLETRRTGLSHVVYNLLTGTAAFFMLGPYVAFWRAFDPAMIADQAEVVLVAFHSSFNLLGVLLVLPLTGRFAALMMRLLPENDASLVRRLDTRLLQEPGVALEAVNTSLWEIYTAQMQQGVQILQSAGKSADSIPSDLSDTLRKLQNYLRQINSTPQRQTEWRFLMACIHALDHMKRLQYRLQGADRLADWRQAPQLVQVGEQLLQAMDEMRTLIDSGQVAEALQRAADIADECKSGADALRQLIMSDIAAGQMSSEEGARRLRTARWMRRVAAHLWRIQYHLQLAADSSQSKPRAFAEIRA